MVIGKPIVSVTSIPGYGPATPGNEQIWGLCVESTKGPSFTPTLVQSEDEEYALFKTRTQGFWRVNGQGMLMVRVTAGTPVAAIHILKDNATTGVSAITLTALQEGSYPIQINASNNGTTNNLIIEEDGFPPEYYLNVPTMAELVTRINNDSQIVSAELEAEGSGLLATVVDATLGSGAGNTAGSDGTVDSGSTTGELAEADAPAAHRQGLVLMENYIIRGAFTVSPYADVHDEYAIHAKAMSQADKCQWRYAVVGVTDEETSKSEIIDRVNASYDDEHILFVGQGLVDKNGVEYAPYQSTVAIAGKRSALPYGQSIWGGAAKKLLGKGDDQFFVDVLPMVSAETVTKDSDIKSYNENGVITFRKDPDGIRILEGVTSVSPTNVTQEDEEAVVSIVDHAKYIIYDVCFKMSGENLVPSYKTTLEQSIQSALEVMKNTDKTIQDYSEEGIKAYTVNATIVPRANQLLGKVIVDATITPVHAAREIRANVVVQ